MGGKDMELSLIRQKRALWLNIIGWIAFLEGIVFVLWPFISIGAFYPDARIVYSIDVVHDTIIVVAGVFVLRFSTYFKNGRINFLQKIVIDSWSAFFCFFVAAIKCIQMNYSLDEWGRTIWIAAGTFIITGWISFVLAEKTCNKRT